MTRERSTLPIYNLGCGGGGALAIERALTKVPGVVQAYVNPLTEMAYVVYDPAQTSTDQLTRVIDQLGYGAPRVEARRIRGPSDDPPAAQPWQGRRQVLTVGLCLSALYALGLVIDMLFPSLFQTYRFWEALLIGVRWAIPWTLLLGLLEVFLAGALAGWAFTRLRRPRVAPAVR